MSRRESTVTKTRGVNMHSSSAVMLACSRFCGRELLSTLALLRSTLGSGRCEEAG